MSKRKRVKNQLPIKWIYERWQNGENTNALAKEYDTTNRKLKKALKRIGEHYDISEGKKDSFVDISDKSIKNPKTIEDRLDSMK